MPLLEDKSPRLIKRHCGGYLAVSNDTMSLKIGVMAETLPEARHKFRATLLEWEQLLRDGRRADGPAIAL